MLNRPMIILFAKNLGLSGLVDIHKLASDSCRSPGDLREESQDYELFVQDRGRIFVRDSREI